MDDDSYGVGCDDQDALEAAASFSATFIANAIADLTSDAAATPSIVDATGWLIEKDDPPVYCVLSDDYDEHWTNDANRALRFARQEDAQAYSDHIGWTSPPVRIAEHMWPERTRDVAQPSRGPREALRSACAAGGELGCSCADQNYQWYGPSCETTMTSVMRTMLKDETSSISSTQPASAQPAPEISDIRWAVNVLLEKIAERFDKWNTADVWRDEAAATVRSFKHAAPQYQGPLTGEQELPAPACHEPHNIGEVDPTVTPDCAGAGTPTAQADNQSALVRALQREVIAHQKLQADIVEALGREIWQGNIAQAVAAEVARANDNRETCAQAFRALEDIRTRAAETLRMPWLFESPISSTDLGGDK